MIHVIGYAALLLNLTSMTMKNMLYLRYLSMIANGMYVMYGIGLNAWPIIIGCSIATLIHGYQIYIHLNKKRECNLNSVRHK